MKKKEQVRKKTLFNRMVIKPDRIPGGTHPFFYHPFISNFTPIIKGGTVLDLGFGKGINGYLVRSSREMEGVTIIGLENNNDYINFCKKHNIYDKIIKHSLPTIPLPDKSVDFILCIEVIEHLTRKDGQILLSEIDRVCRGRVIITTPNMFFETIPWEKGDDHLSLWTINDFKSRNYKVRGMGIKLPLLWGDFLLPLKQALYYISAPVSYIFPKIAGSLLAIKDYELKLPVNNELI